MSPVAAPTLLTAALRTRTPEDRVTDVLAYLLQHDSGARDAFCDLVNAPRLAHADVMTQRIVEGERIDCEVRLTEGTALHVIWIEVKVGTADEQPRQLERYACSLWRLYPHRHTLVALAPTDDRLLTSADRALSCEGEPVADRTATRLTWEELGAALSEVGAARGGRQWRRSAQRADERADQRALADVIDHLEREGLVPSEEPIRSSDAHVAGRAYDLLDAKAGAIPRLLELAIADVEAFRGQEVVHWGAPFWHGRSAPWPGGWPNELNKLGSTYATLFFAPHDQERRDEARLEPAFFASINFERVSPDLLALITDPEVWIRDSVIVHPERRNARISKVLYLSELAVRGITLSLQGEALGKWAASSFGQLADLPDPRIGAITERA